MTNLDPKITAAVSVPPLNRTNSKMTKLDEIQALYAKLKEATAALAKIDGACWQPGRKPSTVRREATIAAIKAQIAAQENESLLDGLLHGAG